ncbi:MAG: DEAD/DEAH box helicase [Patescibacteria group bacterium]|nr:DEAD/DEAH box helicase [Patescibacteria group bacterium]
MEKFRQLGISEDILKSIEELGFTEPTEIQQKGIPLSIEGKDVIGGSATGSGKTLVFGVPILQNIQRGQGIQALILTPTRELAEQIYNALGVFSKYNPLNIVTVYGGVSINPQFKAIKSADIVVGTPGRVLDHLQRDTLNLSKVKHLVLDEADRMLDMGFQEDVNKIISQCPTEKQMLLFSATIPPDIEDMTNRFMNNPVKVSAGAYVDPKKLNQFYYDIKSNVKFSLLAHLLKEEATGLVMVFCNSRSYTETVAKNLKKTGLDAIGIHGGLSQNRRQQVLDKFNSGKAFILVCTDVAARGLDIPGVSHVYNYDIPHDSNQYIHRIGRTARAGKSGKIVNLICDRDHENFSRVLRDYDVSITKLEKPYVEKIDIGRSPDRQGPRRGGSRGGSRSGGYSGSSRGSRRYSQKFDRPRRSESSRDGPRSNTSRDSTHTRQDNRVGGQRSDRSRRSEGSRRGSAKSGERFNNRRAGPAKGRAPRGSGPRSGRGGRI